jgi:hypothetical protein
VAVSESMRNGVPRSEIIAGCCGFVVCAMNVMAASMTPTPLYRHEKQEFLMPCAMRATRFGSPQIVEEQKRPNSQWGLHDFRSFRATSSFFATSTQSMSQPSRRSR